MVRVFVIGVGMTKFEKPGKAGDYPELAREAIVKALEDAKTSFTEVEKAVAGYVYGDSTCGQRAIYEVGTTGIPIFNVNNNCSTGSSALYLAKQLIETGSNCVLAVGFDKMERGSLQSKYNDRTNPLDKHVALMADICGIEPSPITPQMFGNAGLEHMKKYGTKPEHFAKIAYKNHKHSVNNPYSQFQDEYTLEQILKSPQIFGPLTKLQCCPTSDGAAAAIIASENFVKRHGLENQAVEILSLEVATDLPSTFQERSCIKLVGFDLTKLAAEKAFQKANLRPSDVQVVELHDCFSANELITYEALGLCPVGHAGRFIDAGDNTYGGKFVVNPSGGLISKGHPLGATGIAQCAELCWQLRGLADKRQVPGAKVGLQHNLGLGGAAVVGIYALGFPSSQPAPQNNQQLSNKGPAGFNVTPYLAILEKAMNEDKDNLIERHRGIYGFKVKKANGEEAFWVINAKVGKGYVEYNSKLKPEVTFTVNDEDIVDLILGKLNPQKAFFQGKVKIQGNMGLAMKLTELQRSASKKIEELRSKL